VFFLTARKEKSKGLTKDYCKSLLEDSETNKKVQQRDDTMKNGGVFTLTRKDFSVMDVGNCKQVMAALDGEQANVGLSFAPEIGMGSALFASGRLSAFDLTSHSSYADVVSDMERRFGAPGKKDTVSREGWPPVQEMRWERDRVGAAVWKAPFSDDVVILIGFLEPPYDSFLRGTSAPESSVFSPDTCKPTITSDLKKVHIPPENMAGLLYHRVPAVYPEAAKQSRIEGVVSLDVIVDDCGNVVESKPISGPEQLVAAATTAVKEWKYRPLALWGQPKTAFESEQKVRFVLPH
jgi:TonB family protein